jgi:hypothetical protein
MSERPSDLEGFFGKQVKWALDLVRGTSEICVGQIHKMDLREIG